MVCAWCGQHEAKEVSCTVYWELPDGTSAIEITKTPGVKCKSCGMEYQTDEIIEQIEDQLLLIDTNKLEKSVRFAELMNMKRLLKYNYFRF
ncbi:hypothetical protein JCM9140_886 [Halalkalibacter wakoensis JCM 9140]|uniref:Uncharacterized protein n=1 Tax=Halalkalibacter wakoensis JCM 9140 TaxID=1236970 RepID=W4PYP1_9BACI|nr:YokU family protein [Halalkalibacter wakoensis]GAE24921.1 hypothetical protein JCM9140_886 [Halalkalibacter wakoensis JCM 9140]